MDRYDFGMVNDDELSQGLKSNIQELQNVLRAYEECSTTKEQLQQLIDLQGRLSKNIQKIHKTICPSSQNPQAKFDRTRFYSEDSPYVNKMDKSGSFRLVPPMKVRSKTTPTQLKKKASTKFLLSSLQLLENIRNLQRLQKSSVRDEASIDEPTFTKS